VSERTTPQRVGRYRIEGILGEGAMAVVYAGFDPDIKRQVAIKCLHAEVAADPAYRRRFLIEAQAAGHLTHPHIVTLFDVGETADNRSYIAMERLSGETLASRVMHEGYPPLPVIINLAEQIAGALDYAHAQGVVHHDIKPENIMLSDGWQQAKVSDFGIAERGAPRQSGSRRAEIGGTPSYMALEHLRGEPTDGRSDLFSLGVVLFWLITGTLPWAQTADVPRLLEERLRLPKPAIQPREPAATPSMLLEIVHTLLAPAPADRYLRGAEVIDDLRLARREYERLQDQPLAGRIGSLRLRWAGLLGGILSLTLMLGLAAIYAKQNVAVTGLALDFGSSLGRMIASESAENLLLDDRAATRALVEDIARNEQIHYLSIADRQGKVIASTVPDQIGAALPALSGQTPLAREGDIHSYRSRTGGTTKRDGMLLFDMPIHYQNTTVGALRLGVSDAPLRAAQKTTLWVIVAVLVLTLAAVIGAVYWLFRRLLPLLNVLGEAMLRVARGDLGHRIRLSRRDELGRLFSTFNLMNAALQDRQPEAGRPATGRATADISQPTRILVAASPHADDG
jgi:tRNA A-37 threonylcarbamoyl transferase component Bud32